MGGGYVLDFSNRTFAKFVADSVGRDIYSDEYAFDSGSKANRLRAFWAEEPNHVAGKLTNDLLDYYVSGHAGSSETHELKECRRIAQRLLQGAPFEDFNNVTLGLSGSDFDVVVGAVKEAIEKNRPEAGLDRLHTFTLKYLRSICEKRGIDTDRDKPLHSLFGEYVKRLRSEGLVESDMTERILKSTISTMEAFNRVRNNQSLAHDNPVLNYEESLLIFNHVCNVLRFIRDREAQADGAGTA
jgi:Abortive infection C-terminus